MEPSPNPTILPPTRLALIPAPIREISLNGHSGYHLVNDWISLHVDEIANNRNPGNRSGSLSLELWALPAPYQGGAFFGGHLIAGCQLEPLRGENCYRNLSHSQQAQTPPPGIWYLSLMIREWDMAQYVTRDHMSFPQPVRADSITALNLAG